LLQVEAEQRKRFEERSAPTMISARLVRDGVERREPLVDANRVVRAQHRHRRSDVDARRASGDRGAEHFGRRNREITPVMLAKADEVESELVCEHRLVDDVAEDLGVGKRLTVRVGGEIAEGV
jgi:hypothetical protein